MKVTATDRPIARHFALPPIVRRIAHTARVGAFALAACSVAWAADDTKIIFPSGASGATAPAAHGTAAGANLFTLIVAVLLAAVGGWVFWRNRRGPMLARGTQSLTLEETRSLGNRQYLVVASYEGQKFLLGVCPGRIDLLSPLVKSEEGHSAR